jgi:tetratricopeptide (TPR) repeat protein
MKKLLQFAVCCLGLSLALSGFAADTAERAGGKIEKQLSKAQDLVKAGKFKEAYNLLQPLEFEQAGNVQYDYLLGVSAVNAGKPDRATIALERIVTTNPGYGDVRQWLGIAYYQSGDMERSKKEFNTILAQHPSAQVKATANQYLAAIKQQQDAKEMAAKKAQQPYLLGNVELGYGHDSSVATVPEDYPGAYYATTNQLAPAGKPTIPSGVSDNFALLNLNMEGRVPFSSAGTYGFMSVDSNNRSYNDHSMMNSHTSLVKGGVSATSKGDTYRFDVARRGYRQEGTEVSSGYTNNSSQNSVTGDARFMMTGRDYWAFTLQYNTPRFSTSPDQDTNQTMVGTNFMHIFAQEGSPLVYFALNHARDSAVRDLTNHSPLVATTDVSRNTNTVMLYSQYSFIPDADVLGMWMKSFRKDSKPYARAYVQELPYGRDGMTVIMLGMNWRPVPNWIVHPQWMRIKNDSNIPLYSFQKTEFSVSVKREFK